MRRLAAGFCAAGLAAAGLVPGAPTIAAPLTATVPFDYPFSPFPFPGPPTVTVTQIVAGPPRWGYKITQTPSPGPAPLPAVWNRISIDFDVPCNAPKSSGGSFRIIPSTGPAQHYVLFYPVNTTGAVITVVCEARPTGAATFEMLDASLHAYERGSATVAGPGR
jgi:hypothetical protein